MGLIRNFEQSLEKAFEGTFSRIFKVGVHPIEIAKRVSREAEAGKRVTSGEVLMPNVYEIYLSSVDFDRITAYRATLVAELETLAFEIASKNGYALLTRPSFLFRSDMDLREGQFELDARISSDVPAGEGGPAPEQPEPARRTATLSVTGGSGKGSTYVLGPLTSLGRAEDNDVVVDDQLVSRHHAVIKQEAGRFVVADLGSTNGTFVDGRRTQERILTDGDGIEMGGDFFSFQPVLSRPVQPEPRQGLKSSE